MILYWSSIKDPLLTLPIVLDSYTKCMLYNISAPHINTYCKAYILRINSTIELTFIFDEHSISRGIILWSEVL